MVLIIQKTQLKTAETTIEITCDNHLIKVDVPYKFLKRLKIRLSSQKYLMELKP